MNKKNETEEKPIELRYEALKRSYNGLTGHNTMLKNQIKDLNVCIDSLRDEITRQETIVSGLTKKNNELNRELRRVRDELSPLRANVEHYNALPWYRKMFTFRVN